MSAAPVTDAEREQIRVLHARGMTCGQIAAELGRNKATVTRQCKAMNLPFDRSGTAQATQAKAADNRARRAELHSLLLDDAKRLRERAWAPYTVVAGTGEGLETIELDLPPAQDVRAFYNAIGTCVDKTLAMEKHDGDDSQTEAAKSVLSAVLDNLIVKHGDGS